MEERWFQAPSTAPSPPGPHEAAALRSRCVFPSQPTDGARTQRRRSERAEQSGAPKPRSPQENSARCHPRPPGTSHLISPSPLPIPAAQIGPAVGQHRRSPFPKPTPSKRGAFPKALLGSEGEEEKSPSFTRERENEGGERARGSQQTPKKAARIPFVGVCPGTNLKMQAGHRLQGIPKGTPVATLLSPRSESLCSGMGRSLQPPPSGLRGHREPQSSAGSVPSPPAPQTPPLCPAVGSPSSPSTDGINPMAADGGLDN